MLIGVGNKCIITFKNSTFYFSYYSYKLSPAMLCAAVKCGEVIPKQDGLKPLHKKAPAYCGAFIKLQFNFFMEKYPAQYSSVPLY